LSTADLQLAIAVNQYALFNLPSPIFTVKVAVLTHRTYR
jgi:hypothetical protein